MTPAIVSAVKRLKAETGGQVKIERVDVYPARYPMTGYFKFFTGPHGRRGRALPVPHKIFWTSSARRRIP